MNQVVNTLTAVFGLLFVFVSFCSAWEMVCAGGGGGGGGEVGAPGLRNTNHAVFVLFSILRMYFLSSLPG